MRVARAFDRAGDYDSHAIVQQRVATQLAARVIALDLPESPHILEVGCGTGFLGLGLIDRLPYGHYLMTDIAPGMIDRARRRFAGRDNISFAVMDGANPDLDGPFDLICSSLAMQWIGDLPLAIDRLRSRLSPHGRLAFTTLAAGSFTEWREAYGRAAPGMYDYPTADRLAALGLDVSIETIEQTHANAQDFLRALKAIGAATPRPGYRPLAATALRDVMQRFDAAGAKARYVVATCIAGPRKHGQ